MLRTKVFPNIIAEHQQEINRQKGRCMALKELLYEGGRSRYEIKQMLIDLGIKSDEMETLFPEFAALPELVHHDVSDESSDMSVDDETILQRIYQIVEHS